MPSRLPTSLRRIQQVTNEPYVCLSCLSKAAVVPKPVPIKPTRGYRTAPVRDASLRNTRRVRSIEPTRQQASKSVKRSASNGSLASSSAINAPTTVPQPYRELYQRLLVLQEAASSYVDRSRLQLATRSLESHDPVLRVALLGLGRNGGLAARKLARVLLSDALSEEQPWESEIGDSMGNGRSLLLRYGDEEDAIQSNPLVQTLHIPSLFLQRHNLEILITGMNSAGKPVPGGNQAALEEAVLVPPLTTSGSSEGRVGFVRYPVHKAVIVAQGVTGAVDYGHFPTALAENSLINAALSVSGALATELQAVQEPADSKLVDVDLAQHALDLFRDNKANGARFSEEWQRSRVISLSNWITGRRDQRSDKGLEPAIRDLIESLLSNAESSIIVSEDAERNLAMAITVPDSKRTSLQSAISNWSAEAHRDLQTNLDTAIRDSYSWRRTVWWRLFWRIDDVTVSASDVLRNYWLTEAERTLAFISGRLLDSGMATAEELNGISALAADEAQQAATNEAETGQLPSSTAVELAQKPSILAILRQRGLLNTTFDQPWPQTIALTRQYMLQTLVPDLHRKAQALLLTSFSTIGGSTALGVWFWAATAGYGLYESGAIIALGLVWSLRRLQWKWSKERDDFAITVREDARSVIAEVETQLRRLVRDGGRASVRPADERSWREARGAVETCRLALKKIDSKP